MKNKFINFGSKNVFYNPNLRIKFTHYVAIIVLILNAFIFTESIISISIQLFLAIVVFFHNLDDKILGKILLQKSKQLENQTVILQDSLTKAESATKAKSIFLANMSHEIRTPLNGIIGFLNILESTSLTKEQKEHLKVINSSSHMLLSIINGILDFSKIEANKLELDITSFNVYEDLLPSFEMFKVTAIDKGIEFKIVIDEDIPLLKSDILRIKQILINLINNAIKFTKEGSVTLNIKILEKFNDNVKLKISVKDTGIGIAKEKQDLVFEEFRQSDSSISREYSGTGLGLSITKKLLSLFGSKLELSSELNNGSDFNFELDCKLSKDKLKIEANETVEKDFSSLSILVAEDNEVNQMLLTHLLEKKSINFNFQNNGVDVVCEYKERHSKYDLILMDINMPKLDGINATLQIQEFEKKNNIKAIPIIALTASTLVEDVLKFKETGMIDYLSKPIDKEKLFGLLSKYISSNKNNVIEYVEYDKNKVAQSMELPLEFLDDLLKMFIDQVEKQIIELYNASKLDEIEKIKSIAHNIKGSAANLRIEPIRLVANKLESKGVIDDECKDLLSNLKCLTLEYKEKF